MVSQEFFITLDLLHMDVTIPFKLRSRADAFFGDPFLHVLSLIELAQFFARVSGFRPKCLRVSGIPNLPHTMFRYYSSGEVP